MKLTMFTYHTTFMNMFTPHLNRERGGVMYYTLHKYIHLWKITTEGLVHFGLKAEAI